MEQQRKLWRLPAKIRFSLFGAFLSFGAPVGWLVLRSVLPQAAVSSLLMVYLTGSTLSVFTLFGYFSGCQQEKLETLADTDQLTGLYNQSAFFHLSEVFLSLAERKRYPVSFIMMDIDNFKSAVDSEGHLFGNFILREIGNILRRLVRKHDVSARFGGDEFVICLAHADATEAAVLAERIRKTIEQTVFRRGDQIARLTMSLGISESSSGTGNQTATLLKTADEALFEAKHGGKNRVVIHRTPASTHQSASIAR